MFTLRKFYMKSKNGVSKREFLFPGCHVQLPCQVLGGDFLLFFSNSMD